MQIIPMNERWENWIQFTQSLLVPKFTPTGFVVLSTPPSVHAQLVRAVREGIADFDSLPFEKEISNVGLVQFPPNMGPKFFDIEALGWNLLQEVQAVHEAWVGGMALTGSSAFGVRMYQRGTSVVMHSDRVSSDVNGSHVKKICNVLIVLLLLLWWWWWWE